MAQTTSPAKNVIVGTAGHIDHGKSALVEALTGTHPDRLEEEKRRGITIDLGFAFLELEGVRLGFVDVPGHEKFVRNMLAGAGGIDLVLLVVAADEGIKPQTREHFDICRLLGVLRGLTVITKADLADADALELVRLEVGEFLRGSFLEGAPVVAVSARTGAGLDLLKSELQRTARGVPGKDSSQHFRLPIDRAFAVKGFGTVVTGTLVAGHVAPEDEVELFPARKRLRVRGVQSEGKPTPQAVAGQRTAANLAGVDLTEVARGMTLAAAWKFEPTRRMDARLTLLDSARPLKNHAHVHLHHFTAETMAEAVLLEGAELRAGESSFVQLRLKDPLLALPGDRFIIRQFSPLVTIGGGAVLHNLARRHRKQDPPAGPLLEAFESGERARVLPALVAADPRGLTEAQVIARTGWQEEDLRGIAAGLEKEGVLRVLPGAAEGGALLVSSAAVAECVRRVREAIEAFHKANPLLPGIPKEDLRKKAGSGVLRRAGVPPPVFRAALEALAVAREATVAGDVVKRAGREIALLPEEAKAKEQIEREFERGGLAVPSLKEVLGRLAIEPRRAQKILQILLRDKTLVKITEDLIFHRGAIARLREMLAGYKQQKGERLAIAAFKELTGISRKYAIPLLEFLDRERVTRRVGDERVIL